MASFRRKRRQVLVAAAALLAAVSLARLASHPGPRAGQGPAAPAPPPERAATALPPQPDDTSAFIPPTVFIYYYAWYGAPPFTPSYGHWDGGGALRPPADIAAAFYPVLGPYSSNDPRAIQQHVAWIKQAKADVLVLSWWGKGSYSDQNARPILDGAAAGGLKVCFQIEPYQGRTDPGIVSDMRYIAHTFGQHPAYYRTARPTLHGPNAGPRGLFFVYELPGSVGMIKALDAIRGTPDDAIVLGRMADNLLYADADVRRQLSYTHADGLYNYGATEPDSHPFPKSRDYMLVYAVLPGWDHTRIPPYQDQSRQSREQGRYYDGSWQEMVRVRPEGVAIISFNEWHEGGQIEPAKPYRSDDYTYQDYEGAYGLTGSAASLAYLTRTAYWVDQYKR